MRAQLKKTWRRHIGLTHLGAQVGYTQVGFAQVGLTHLGTHIGLTQVGLARSDTCAQTRALRHALGTPTHEPKTILSQVH